MSTDTATKTPQTSGLGSVHFFEGTEGAFYHTRSYRIGTSDGPVVVPVPEYQEVADFFDQTSGSQDTSSTFSTPASIENPEVPQTTFFCNSSGVRLHQCALYAIDRCAAGFFELPEKPSGQYLKALQILRNPSQGLNDTFDTTESSSVAITYMRRSHQPDYSPAERDRSEGQRCPLPAAENRSLTPTHVPREGLLS